MSHTLPRPRPRAFTLIELLVVILILATIAGLVISRVDWVQESAKASTAAAGMAQVQNNLQLYRANKRQFPSGFDSLLVDPAGAPQVLGTVFGETLPSPSLSWLEVTTFPAPATPGDTNTPVYSLTKLGIDRVYDHDAAVPSPNDGATIARTFSAFDPTADAFATVDAASPIGSRLVSALYPGGGGALPAGVSALVAFGVGPGCSAVGTTMASAPVSPATDPNQYYSRYIALFAVYADGRAAQLKTVVDSSGSVVGDQLQAYYQSTPE